MFNPNQIARFHTMYTKTDTCWLWNRAIMNGYGSFSVTHIIHGVKRKYINAHRYSYMLHNSLTSLIASELVCHKCDIRHCVNPSHLYLGTYKDNANDAESRNRVNHVRGEKHGRSKLTEQQVISIREEYLTGGISQKSLATKYVISRWTIGDIIYHRRWNRK